LGVAERPVWDAVLVHCVRCAADAHVVVRSAVSRDAIRCPVCAQRGSC